MKSEAELISFLKQRLSDWADWGPRIEALASEFGTVTPNDIALMEEDRLWRLWKCPVFAETGTFDVPKPLNPEGWKQLREVTSILADRTKPLGERYVFARIQCKQFFGAQNAPQPAIYGRFLF